MEKCKLLLMKSSGHMSWAIAYIPTTGFHTIDHIFMKMVNILRKFVLDTIMQLSLPTEESAHTLYSMEKLLP